MTNLDHFIAVRNNLTYESITPQCIKGKITLSCELISSIKELYNNRIIDTDDIRINNKIIFIDNLKPNCIYEVILTKSLINGYYESIDDFLKKNIHSLPHSEYYIYELKWKSSNCNIPKIIEKYNSVIELIELISKISDYKIIRENKLTYIFFHDTNYPLNITYSINDLDGEILNLKKIANIINKEDNKYFDEKISILKLELIQFISRNNLNNCFEQLIQEWENFLNNYNKSEYLFLEGFSVEKIKNELREQNISISKKLHDALDGMGSKILVIPIGYYLLLTKLEFKTGFSMFNIIVIAIALTFSIILHILLNNQSKYIDILYNSFNELEKTIDSTLKIDIEEITTPIEKLKNNQLFKIKTIIFVIWAIFAIITITVLYYLIPSSEPTLYIQSLDILTTIKIIYPLMLF